MEIYDTKETLTGKERETLNVMFSSPDDMREYIKSHASTEKGSSTVERTDKKFSGFLYKEANEKFYVGWPEGSKEIDIRIKKLEGYNYYAPQTTVNYDVTGDYIDIGRYMEGVPETFGFFDIEDIKRDKIDVMVNIGALGGVDKDTIYNRGVAVLAVIDRLQSMFHEVNLKIVRYTDISREHLTYNDKSYGILKTSVDVDLKNTYSRDLLVYMLCSASYLRMICFRIMEIVFNCSHAGGYGCTADIENIPEGTVYFPGLTYKNDPKYKTIELTKQTIERIINGIQE